MSDGGLRQENGKIETSLGYITTSCQNKKKKERKEGRMDKARKEKKSGWVKGERERQWEGRSLREHVLVT